MIRLELGEQFVHYFRMFGRDIHSLEWVVLMVKQLDGNDDGLISEDEAPEQMKQFFSMIDSNGDGSIDATEMIMVIQFMDQ